MATRYNGKVCDKHPELNGLRYVAHRGCVACRDGATKVRRKRQRLERAGQRAAEKAAAVQAAAAITASRPQPDRDAMHDRAHSIDNNSAGQRFVITGAQNATPINQAFFESLLTYCELRGAELLVIPYRYKNPTSQWTENNDSADWWAPEVLPYLLEHRVRLGQHMEVLGDIKVQPTAKRPTSGFETITGARSAIIAHPKLELVTVPTPQTRLPKLLATTGVCTERNYVDARAGKQGEFHHTFGAAVVEVTESGGFHLRQLNAAANGTFCDLDGWYAPKGEHSSSRRVKGLVMGDEHVRFVDPAVVKATFGPGGMVDVLRPEYLVWHDVHDGYSINPHGNDLFEKFVKAMHGENNVEAELTETFRFIDDHHREGVTHVFPFSNHPGWLGRWMAAVDPRQDPLNAVFWAKTLQMVSVKAHMGESGPVIPDPFVLWAKQKLECFNDCRFLSPDESFQIEGIEVGMHGHLGPNGSRGVLRAFTKLGTKAVIGHSHTPGIMDGIYQVGTSSRLRLGYNRGPSSWLQTHCVIYSNGKRSLINIIDGEWRG